MVEFAIGAGVLTTSFAGAFTYGYTFYRYNTLLAAVNAGARYASLAQLPVNVPTTSTACPTSYSTAVKNVVVYGGPTVGTTRTLPNLQTSHVNCLLTLNDGVPSHVTVWISGYTLPAIFRSITFNNKPKVKYAYQGILTPTAGGF